MRPFYLQPTSPVRGLLKAWFESLPKILWERGVKDEGASEALLRFLLEVARRGEKGFSLFERSVRDLRACCCVLTNAGMDGCPAAARALLFSAACFTRSSLGTIHQAHSTTITGVSASRRDSLVRMGRESRLETSVKSDMMHHCAVPRTRRIASIASRLPSANPVSRASARALVKCFKAVAGSLSIYSTL